MSTPYESARLILELYELRREPLLRQAREWFTRQFHVDTVQELQAVFATEHNPHFRMVTGYWDMAASLVAHGAIDREMFLDANGEIVVSFSKIHHVLDDFRRLRGQPDYLKHFEQLVLTIPDVEARLAKYRTQFRPAAAK